MVVGQKKHSWLVTDGNGIYAHGDTAREAKEEYALSEIVEATSGAYGGSTFRAFFINEGEAI